MQFSYYLDKSGKSKNGLIPVFYSLTFEGNRIRKKIKTVNCLEKHWNKKAQRIKSPVKSETYNYHIEYNKILDEVEDKAKKIFRYILLNDIVPTKKFILEKLAKKETVNLAFEFFTSFDEFIEINKVTKAKRTIKSYKSVYNFLEEFEKVMDYKLTFDSINLIFYDKLQDFTFKIRKNRNSHFAVSIKIIKTFLSWSIERNYHSNLAYKKFKAKEDETEVIYLTLNELKTLYEFNFKTERLNKARDIYCFNCFTGLRISDTIALKTTNIKENHILITVQKTKTKLFVPLNKFAKEILNKYKDTIYEPLPVISKVKSNKYIKECCKEIGIDNLITITRFRGEKRIDKTVPKHKLITNHTARKTFITNSLIKGMNEQTVRKITGSKGRSFSRYVDVSNDIKQQEMDNTWDKIQK